MSDRPADPAADGWKPRSLEGFAGLVGPLWTRKEGESWAYGLLAEAKHANPAGLVHGGMLMTLIDHALSAIAWEAAERKPCVTVQVDVKFIAPVRPGQFVEARGRVLKRTSGLVFMQGVLAAQGAEVASAVLKIVG